MISPAFRVLSSAALLLMTSFAFASPAASDAAATDPGYARINRLDYPVGASGHGSVMLKVFVGVDGNPEKVELDQSSGSSVFDEAAVAGVSKWMFAPAQRDGKPVAAWVRVPIRFEPLAEATSTLDEIYVRKP
jgi:TonB family protein